MGAWSNGSRIVRELLESAGRLAAWSEDGSPEARLRAALAAYAIRLQVGPVDLAAHVDESLALSVTIAGSGSCTPEVERALRAALRDHPSPVARLVDLEWDRVIGRPSMGRRASSTATLAPSESIARVARRKPARRRGRVESRAVGAR